jgi:hypothetical protein
MEPHPTTQFLGSCAIIASATGCQLIAGIGDLKLAEQPADTAAPVLIASVAEGTRHRRPEACRAARRHSSARADRERC